MITFRRATVADAPTLSAFARRMFDDTFGPHNEPADMKAYTTRAFSPAAQARELADPARACLVAESDRDGTRAIAGYALLHVGSTDPCVTGPYPVEIERFYVDTPWHATGTAHTIMTRVMETALELEGETLWLGVWTHNPRAIAFYTKEGFVDVGEHSFVLGTDVQVDRVMARPI